jgi:hypothetical protein
MSLAFLTLITGLAISAVAIYYSVIGLAAIFSAAVIPIIVMGSILEVSKLVSAWWLKANWHRAPILLKSYMLVAVVVLMLITSMGIFGFLSKAHTDQAITSGDVQGRIALYDEKIKIERENIANAQSLIKQMDAVVNGIITTGDQEFQRKDGTTGVRSAAERSLQIRRSQAKDRAALTKQIEESQDRIVKLQEEAAPIRSEVRKVEAEVGPIKYIAQLIYGDNPDNNLLEKAVTWVIITIVFVFDPLAVLLLLASQMSFQWARQEKERNDELVQESTLPEDAGQETPPASEPVVGAVDQGSREQSQPDTEPSTGLDVVEEANRKIAEIETEFVEPTLPEEVTDVKDEEDEDLFEEDDTEAVREAKRLWKKDHPEDSLKRHKRLFERGLVSELPWERYLKIEDDYVDDEAAEEAAKWAKEQLEKKKADDVAWIEQDEKGNQIKKTLDGYQQNAEQNESTLWNRVKQSKENKDE